MASFDANMLKDPKVRAIEIEANRLAGADGDNSLAERFQIRNQLRAEAGMKPEKRKRGGLAGAWDEGFLLPAAAIALGPLALGAAGVGGGGTAAGGTAASMGGIPALPAAGGAAGAAGAVPAVAGGGGGVLGTLGGLAGKAGDFLNNPIVKGGMGVITALDAAGQRKRADDLTNRAIAADTARWKAGAPLREEGSRRLLNPVPVNTSSLAGNTAQNPFARRAVPASGGY